MNKKIFIIITNDIITRDIIFKILMNFFKKFQDVSTRHKIDIIKDNDSNIIINEPIIKKDIEDKHL